MSRRRRGLPALAVLAVLAVLTLLGIIGCSTGNGRSQDAGTAALPPAASAPATQQATHHMHHHKARHRHHKARHKARQVAAPAPVLACDGALWNHVYHAYRLHVVTWCTTVTGTVAYVSQEPDGDLHVNVRLDARYAWMINNANRTGEYGNLVTEAICEGTITQADAVSPCQGTNWTVTTPAVGDRVRVTGSYVLDADHGWMEIHPVSYLHILSGHSAPAPVAAPGGGSGGGSGSGGSPWCTASASYSSSYGDYDVYVHSNEPDTTATASGGGVSKSWTTNGSGYADIYWRGPSGTTITVTVGGASCSTSS